MILVLILPIIGIVVYFVAGPDVEAMERRAGTPQEEPPGVGVADELEKLRRLRDDGTLTAEEFEEQKAALLRARAASGG